jgi:membrane protein
MVVTIKDWIEALVWGDMLRKYSLPGRFVQSVLQNAYAVLRDIVSGQLTLRAMSLVYTTLLSIVPLIAVSFSVLKGFGVHKNLEQYLYGVLEPLGDKGVDITDQVMALVNNVNGGVLGGIGLAFFIYTAISMVQKIEESFNYVWYVGKVRNFARRFTEYLLILLIVPLAIVVALGAIASLGNEAAFQWLAGNAVLGPFFSATTQLTPYFVVIVVFTALYKYMPNTRVDFRSALVGGLSGGILWATLGMIFAAFIANSARNQTIYASFAIAITTLIWLYLNWLILLIGSQIAFYFQNPAYLRIGRREPRLSNAMRERLALNIMFLVGKEFRDPTGGITLSSLSSQLQIPSITLAPISTGLEINGLLTGTENEGLLPGREMSRITLADIVAVVRREGETGSHRNPKWSDPVESLGRGLDDAVADTLSDKTLSDILDASEIEI